MGFRDKDVTAMLGRHFGVPVVYKGRNFRGIFDRVSTVFGDERGTVAGNLLAVTVRTAEVAEIRIDDPIRVDGVDYFVGDPEHSGDAATIKLPLRETR